jgi:hypothetical protein
VRILDETDELAFLRIRLKKTRLAELAAHFVAFAHACQQALEAAHLGTHRPALSAAYYHVDSVPES